MNDGAAHTEVRATITTWFASLNPSRIDAACRDAVVDICTHTNEPTVQHWMTLYPSAAMVRLMGMNPAAARSMADAAKALAAAFGPGASQETTAAADEAVAAIFHALDEPRRAQAKCSRVDQCASFSSSSAAWSGEDVPKSGLSKPSRRNQGIGLGQFGGDEKLDAGRVFQCASPRPMRQRFFPRQRRRGRQ